MDNWISVETKLPEAHGLYLCVNHFKAKWDGNYKTQYTILGFFEGHFQDRLGYAGEVTHWMPLPLPPKTS